MEENFSTEWNMEWKTFGMEWKKIAIMEYVKIVLHSIPCAGAKTSFSSWKQTTNSWKMSLQEMSHGSFNMIQKQNDKVTSGKVRPHPDQRRPACNARK